MAYKNGKFIREDDPELNESGEYVNYLIDAYKQTGDIEYRDCLLDEFDGYLKKYVSILCKGGGSVDTNNKDTKNFLRLLMKKEDRSTENSYSVSSGIYIHMARRVMKVLTAEDIYHELVAIFLELIENYKPITYKRKEQTYRISFAHYIQVNMRYRICRMVVKNSKDIISGRNCLEYNDDLCEVDYKYGNNSIYDDVDINLKDWVWGREASFPFGLLSEMERYLLWLRYEGDPEGKRLSTKEVSDVTGLHERTIIYKLKAIKKKIQESLGGSNELPKM